MSIQYIPLGIPLSSSYAITAKFAVTTSLGGFPVSASYAEYASQSFGPKGRDAVTRDSTALRTSSIYL